MKMNVSIAGEYHNACTAIVHTLSGASAVWSILIFCRDCAELSTVMVRGGRRVLTGKFNVDYGNLNVMREGFSQQLMPGMRLLGEFTVLEHLGRGGMGSVYRVEREIPAGNIQYAAKVLRDDALIDPVKREAFIEEIRTWIGLPDHPNITACRFFRTIGDRLIVFSEYVEGGTLIEWVRGKRLDSPESVLKTIVQCAAGLNAAHQSGVIHQDIKPANILMTMEGIPKITDFGLSRVGRHR